MTYASLLAHVDLGSANEGLFQVVGDLAQTFGSSVLGLVATQPIQIYAGDAYISAEAIDQDRDETKKLVSEAEQGFRKAMASRARDVSWRSLLVLSSLAEGVATIARGADIVAITPDADASFDPTRRVRASDLAMILGRPLLIVPASVKKLDLREVVVGWKDTRESRRAVADALPILKKAAHVTVVEFAAEDELDAARVRTSEVCAWLKRHKVVAEALVNASKSDDSGHLSAFLQERGAGLFVGGAYGHSRLREWALGGVTRDLLMNPPCLALLSH